MTKFTCPYCDSAFLQPETEEMLREHMIKVHGRELSFSGPIGQMPNRSENEKK